ncbi:MAG: hypothetical protein H6744_13205 [Deltaproteobacteria bacterium]|nr:hypothetical protein [Deltaproteobacteria bacterium]
MRPFIAMCALLLVASSAPAPARAQALFGIQGHPQLTPTGFEYGAWTGFGGLLIGRTTDGAIWRFGPSDNNLIAVSNPSQPEVTKLWGPGANLYEFKEPPDRRGFSAAIGRDGTSVWVLETSRHVGDCILRKTSWELMTAGKGIQPVAHCDMTPLVAAMGVKSLEQLSGMLGFRGNVARAGRWLHERPDGKVCAVVPSAVFCVDPTADGPVEVMMTAAELDVPVDVRFYSESPGVVWQTGFQFGPMRWLPDGRHVLILEAHNMLTEPASADTPGTGPRYLFERMADGTLRRLDAEGALDLTGVEQLEAWPGHGAVLAWPLTRLDWNANSAEPNWPQLEGDYGSVHVTPVGFAGMSLGVVPLDEPGAGRLRLMDALDRRLDCAFGSDHEGCIYAPDIYFDGEGRIAVSYPLQPVYETALNEVRHYTLDVDLDAVDLDEDGLSSAEERAAGTSDYLRDTDGGGTSDDIEVLRAGTDPTDGRDDPARVHAAELAQGFVWSPLIRTRFPEANALVSTNPPGIRTPTSTGPLCYVDACWDLDGHPLLHFQPDGLTVTPGVPSVRSADGRFVVVSTAEGLWRVFVDDGRRELYITREAIDALAEFEAVDGYVQLRVIPVDERVTFVVVNFRPGRVLLFEEGEGRVVLDLDRERCLSGMGLCDEGPQPNSIERKSIRPAAGGTPMKPEGNAIRADDINPLRLVPEGWDAATGELLVGVFGLWNVYEVAIGLDGTPTVRRRSAQLGGSGFPDQLLPNERGEVFDGHQLTDAFGAPQASTPIEVVPKYFGAFGDMILTTLYRSDVEPGANGLYELVRDEGRLQPGDLIVVQTGMDVWGHTTASASRVPARGGEIPLWSTPLRTQGPVRGSDVTADGDLCFADGASVHRYAAFANEGGLPRSYRGATELAGAIDCAFEPDGTMLALTGAGEVFAQVGLSAEWTPRPLPPGVTTPVGFVRAPDGSVEVRDTGDPVLAYAVDGSPVERTVDGTIRFGGVAGVAPEIALTNELVPLPDGRVASLSDEGKLVLYDPLTGASPWMTADGFGSFEGPDPVTGDTITLPAALAAVPGGSARDRWTGRPITPRLPGASSTGTQPSPQTASEPRAALTAGGCQGGLPTPADVVLPLLAALAMLVAARRRARLPAPPGPPIGSPLPSRAGGHVSGRTKA